MRGKVPKPTHLHVVEGTLNTTRHRKRKAEPKPVGELSSPPAWMNEGQRERWEYAIRHAPGGLLKKLGESTLTAWAVAAAAHRDLAQNIPRSRPERSTDHAGPQDLAKLPAKALRANI